jgi:outer membrane biosynthesis protein TonB
MQPWRLLQIRFLFGLFFTMILSMGTAEAAHRDAGRDMGGLGSTMTLDAENTAIEVGTAGAARESMNNGMKPQPNLDQQSSTTVNEGDDESVTTPINDGGEEADVDEQSVTTQKAIKKKPKTKPKVKPKSKTKSKAKPKLPSKTKLKTKSQPKPQAKPQTPPASQPVPQPKPLSKSKPQQSPIVGELDDTDTTPMEDGDEIEDDEDDASSSKFKNSKNTNNIDKENDKIKKRDKNLEKLLQGFREAEDFHKKWYNLPLPKIKTSLEKLTKFCKVACTKKQCLNEDVGHNCHLMCPESTIKQCPDPLKQGGEEADTQEVTIGNDESSGDPLSTDDSKIADPTSATASGIEQADRNIPDGEGEGG